MGSPDDDNGAERGRRTRKTKRFFVGLCRHRSDWTIQVISRPETRVDVAESDKEYRVQAELPGVKKEDINVTIDGDQVAISAETKSKKDVKSDEGTVLRSERYYGRLYRSFSLQQKIDQAKAQAKYADGVLELKLPKASSDSARKKRLEVH